MGREAVLMLGPWDDEEHDVIGDIRGWFCPHSETEDWEIKPETKNFIAARILKGKRGTIGYEYTIFVGQWVDEWWADFRRTLAGK